jgi:TolB-like protein
MGDGVLVEFASAVSAVTCAHELQAAMEQAGREMPDNRSIRLRIGINVGDVIAEGSDLYGDGVNLAARLEGIADPGSVVISQNTLNQVQGKVPFVFEDLGEHSLKNLAASVRVHRIKHASGSTTGNAAAKETATLQPSIAVLPFDDMSTEVDERYFSDGVTEDIITELSRFRSLLVIARHSSFQFRGKDIDVRRVGRELNVDYIIEGSIRRSAGRLRITAQLIDAETANHIWAERYDRDSGDLFAVQEEIAQAVASTAGARVEDSRRQRAVRTDSATLEAYDLFLRAKAVNWMYSLEANKQALAWTEKAIKLDPSSAPAHAYYAMARFMQYVGHWTDDLDAALRDAHRYSRKAVELDDSDVDARGAYGQALLAMRKFDEAGMHLSKGVELNPNNTEARCWYGMYLFCVGQYESAIDQFEAAKRRNPIDLAWMPWLKGGAYFTADRYAEAIASFNQIVDPIYEVYGWLAASYAQAGQLDKAHEMLDDFLQGAASDMAASPGPKLADWKPYWRKVIWYQNEADYEHLFQAFVWRGYRNNYHLTMRTSGSGTTRTSRYVRFNAGVDPSPNHLYMPQ